ncbi:MAG: FAD-dependent oxidoreductase, partial [Pseudomonadota bacterium]|nr:FAD-dependent oxidoreductase [Pseudomonadota bacterium]
MLPSQSRVVIIGGGIMGCGLAYHLAHEGWTDVVLLEKAELTSGSTWHAAGQITHSTSSFSLGRCVGYNIELYSEALEKETGQAVSWHGCGSFRLAYTEDEHDWLEHTISVGRALDFPMEIIGPSRIRELHPFYNLDGVIAGLHTPEDGHVDPAGATSALAQGARQLGVTIIRRCRVTGVQAEPNREWRVSTEQGEVVCEHVVNAGGTYARQIGLWTGLDIPTTSMTHHYFVTDTVPQFHELADELPVVRDDRLVSGYVRMEQKSGLIGIYEKANPNPVWLDGCPWEAENELFEPDYDRIMPWLENAMNRMPVLSDLGIKRAVHGAISHPPDGNPLIGPAPGLENYWLNCGCQIGIGWGPGLTRELARWMVHGAADISMRDFDPRRFGPYADQNYQVSKAKEDYLLRHEIPFPHLNRSDGRPVKPSALYEVLKSKGAVFEEVYGWERPRFFAGGDLAQHDHYSFRRAPWHRSVANEVQTVRKSAGIIDISAFAKVAVSGPDAAIFIDRLIPNRLPSQAGRIILTHLLNERGRIELETTIVRLAKDCFYFTCAAFFEQRLLDHLTFRQKPQEQLTIQNLSSDWGALALNGPRSREIL